MASQGFTDQAETAHIDMLARCAFQKPGLA